MILCVHIAIGIQKNKEDASITTDRQHTKKLTLANQLRCNKMKLIALYARVSKTLEQNPENQLIELRRWCTAAGYTIEGEYVDEISSKDTRPEKEKVLRKLRLNQLDGVAFWALDRWGRSISELILELEEFSKSEKIMLSLKEGMDLSTAAGRLMANILACMANFERDRIRERTMLGLARARAQGKKLGRPKSPSSRRSRLLVENTNQP